MTSLGIWVDKQNAVAHMLAEGAMFSPKDNSCIGSANKAIMIPQLNIAVHVKGSFRTLHSLADFIATRFVSYDELVAQLATNVPTFGGEPYAMGVVGWSEVDGPNAFVLATYGDRAGHVRHCLKAFSPRIGPELQHAAAGSEPDWAKIINAQRAVIDPVTKGSLVGCFAQLITVGYRSMTSRILGTWADKFGQPINVGVPFEPW